MTASTVAVYDAIAACYAARRAEMPPRVVQLAQRALAIVRRSGADPIAIADLGCGLHALARAPDEPAAAR